MTGVVITVDDTAAREALAGLGELGEDLTAVMEDIGQQLVTSVLMRFETGRGPGGAPWAPSARAQAEGGQTLVDTGRLRQSVTYLASAREVEVGTNVIYAAIHQFGGTIRAKTARGLAFTLPWLAGPDDDGRRVVRSVTIPLRPFLGLDAEDAADISAIVADHLARAAAGGTPA